MTFNMPHRTAIALLIIAACTPSFGCVSGKCDCQGAACETCKGVPLDQPVADAGEPDVDAPAD
jgi:hypothetical protein